MEDLYSNKIKWTADMLYEMNDTQKDLLSERSQIKKTMRSHIMWFYFYEMPRKGKFIQTVRLVVAWGWKWEQGLTVNAHKESYWGNKNV